MDTFTVDHLLSKLNFDSVKMSWLPPIDDVGLSNYQKYLKPPEKKNVICIPLIDRDHFQGYTISIKEHKIIHIDSLRWDQPKIQSLLKLQKCCLKVYTQPSNPFFRKESNLC